MLVTAGNRHLRSLSPQFALEDLAGQSRVGLALGEGYFHKMADQPEGDRTLLYFLTHKSQEAAKASFAAFGKDPAWKAAREASEKAGGGSLTVAGGVKSVFLVPTDYSPTH